MAQPAFLKEGLVAYYPFNGNANDASENGINLTKKGEVNFSNDRFGQPSRAASFNSLNPQQAGMLKGSDSKLPMGSQQRTVTAWFKAKSIGTADVIYHWGGLKTSSAFYAIIGYGQKILVGQSGGGDNPSWGTIATDQWYSSALVYGVDGIARIYINGSLVASGPRSYSTITDFEGFEIGGYQGVAIFNGEIDDVRIYNRALSDGEVKALYDYESTPPDNSFVTNGLVGFYPFTENTFDASGNANDSKLIGNASLQPTDFSASKSLILSGSINDWVEIPNPNFSFNQTASVSVWYYYTNANNIDARFICGNQNEMQLEIHLGGNPNNRQSGIRFIPSWDTYIDTVAGTPLGKWTHLVCVSGVGVDGIAIYIDGNPVSISRSGGGSGSQVISKGNFYIGRRGVDNGWAHFDGKLNNFRIYNRALSGSEVKALHDYESTPQPLNPRIALATAQVVNGFVVGATITDGGYGYVENPVVTISGGGGTGAKATATQFNGVVTRITITNPGSGYTSTPTITIAPPPFPPKKSTATSQVVNGFVVGTKITDGGFGYDSPPAVLIVGGGGSGAVAVATVANGVVTAITITNPGTGYTSVPIVRIASPPFAPKLGIETSKVYVRMSVVLGRKYQLEASTDLNTWTTTGPAFIAQDEELAQEFDVNQVGRYFRINQVP